MRAASLTGMETDYFARAIADLVPYEPGKPAEEVQRELGLERVVKLASNEGPFGPLPAALEAIGRGAPELNRYPDGGFYQLRAVLAERHGVAADSIAPALGRGRRHPVSFARRARPGRRDRLRLAVVPELRPRRAEDRRASPVRVPLTEDRYDLEALLRAVTPRTKIVYVCNPNNPTGTMVTRAALDEYFENVPHTS